MIEHKRWDIALEIKAVDEEKRQFTGLASTWEKDLGGDVIVRGAFSKTLKEWRKADKVLPLLDSHRYGSISATLGKMIEAKETDAGLEATFQLRAGPQGEEAWDLVREGYIDGLSIGYEARGWKKPTEEEEKDGVWRKLTEVHLVEVSLVQMPMNQGARIAAVKSALDSLHPEEMGDEDRKTLRALNSRIGNLLSAARKSGALSGDTEEVAEAPVVPEGPDGGEGTPPEAERKEQDDPAATPDDSAGSEDGDPVAPEYVKEAFLERISRLKANRTEGGEDDE